MIGSSLFERFKIILILKKQNASKEIRTHNVSMEAQKDLHYAIRSMTGGIFNLNIKFLSLTETVIYFTIYDKLMLSRKLKNSENKFLIDLDRKNIKLISSETSLTGNDKILKMTLPPSGGQEKLV